MISFHRRYRASRTGLLVLVLLCHWPAAVAQEGRIEEIVVTAQKRSQDMQDVPVAVTAVTGTALAERQIISLEELGSVVPNMDFGTFSGQARVAIRGIGFDAINPGAEGRVAYHLDGAYISRPGAQLATFMDVERVEVLRGPQGTLYGRNATGGSVNVHTNQPTEVNAGYARVSYGNYDSVVAEAAVSGPLTEGVKARLAGMYADRDGYGESLVTGDDVDDRHAYGGRAIVAFEPTDAFSITLSGDYYEEDDHNYVVHYFGQYPENLPLFGEAFLGGTVSTDRRDVNTDTKPINQREVYGFAMDAALHLEAFSVRSLTSWRASDYLTASDYDHTERRGVIINYAEEADQVSQELQFTGQLGTGTWLLGAYYFEEDISASSHLPTDLAILGSAPFFSDGYKVAGDLRTEAWAVFGQADLSLSTRLALQLGLRYSKEAVDIDDALELGFFVPYAPDAPPLDPGPPQPPQAYFARQDSTDDRAFTPRVALEYRAADDVLVYASIARGFKSGGFTLANPLPAFEPEKLWAYEIGAKTTVLDHRLRANAAVFYYDYSNLQVSKVQSRTVVVENAAEAELYGAELEFTLLATRRLSIDGAASYLHSEYQRFASQDPGDFNPFDPTYEPPELDLGGNRLYQAPTYTAHIGVEYEWQLGSGTLSARTELDYTSRNYFTAFNRNILSQAGHAKYNAFLTWAAPNDGWMATLYGRNLSDKTTRANGLMGAIDYGGPAVGGLAPPRTFGVRVELRL